MSAPGHASWTCARYHLLGCKVEFVPDGGTGKFSMVTGDGLPAVRTTNLEKLLSAD